MIQIQQINLLENNLKKAELRYDNGEISSSQIIEIRKQVKSRIREIKNGK